MATSGASGSSSISQSPSAIFDPPVVTVTDKLTAIYVKDGDTRTKPMLNNYIRHARVGGGQHGEVFLCFRLDSKLPADDPRRLMPVVRAFHSNLATGPGIQLEGPRYRR